MFHRTGCEQNAKILNILPEIRSGVCLSISQTSYKEYGPKLA